MKAKLKRLLKAIIIVAAAGIIGFVGLEILHLLFEPLVGEQSRTAAIVTWLAACFVYLMYVVVE